MAFQTVFSRYEMKYMLTLEQKQRILEIMKNYMSADKYGRSTIRNVYYDTDTYLLIRRSIGKPIYKEKLRIRSYTQADEDSTVFVELKKKYKKVVYKRRISLPEKEAVKWLAKEEGCHKFTQISKEIDYFLEYYKTLRPVVFLSYEREAYYSDDDPNFRVTFDDNILCRQTDLSLTKGIYGTPILPEGNVLMEIKCSGGIPLWMVDFLSKEKIYKTSFSKYGTAYQTLIFPQLCNFDAKDIKGGAYNA
ncbi:MAG: polyphosphate polymerase domain-containing protein [Clostridia bacterium]|nr:polyphosphate polymerase domain-containing protein [Clostridia bacterium]